MLTGKREIGTDTLFLKRRKGVKKYFTPVAGVELLQSIEFVRHRGGSWPGAPVIT